MNGSCFSQGGHAGAQGRGVQRPAGSARNQDCGRVGAGVRGRQHSDWTVCEGHRDWRKLRVSRARFPGARIAR
eukprot:493802-Pleurochrysis_carterae.AAC.2